MSKEFTRKQLLKNSFRIALAVVVVISLLFGLQSFLSPSLKRSVLRTAIAETGSIEATITASGIVVPEFEQVLTSPVQSKIDSVFHRAGEHIQKGESIVALTKNFY